MKPPREEEMAAHFRRRAVKKKKNTIRFYLLHLALTRASRSRDIIKGRAVRTRRENKKTNYIFSSNPEP